MTQKGIGAWDGTAESFWTAVGRSRRGEDVEGDVALLSDVLRVAMAALETMERLQKMDWEPKPEED